jgi:lipopolysaccharide/colanic/teichoic acid biosynthesis glycosyltransferase
MQSTFRPPRLGDLIRHSQAEFVVACLLLALTLPLMAIVAIAIKCESRGPVFIRAKRLTRHGRSLTTLKFRTAEVLEGGPSIYAPLTRVGRLLRFTRVDGLPQLVNVLRGDMSCLGDPGRPFFLD